MPKWKKKITGTLFLLPRVYSYGPAHFQRRTRTVFNILDSIRCTGVVLDRSSHEKLFVLSFFVEHPSYIYAFRWTTYIHRNQPLYLCISLYACCHDIKLRCAYHAPGRTGDAVLIQRRTYNAATFSNTSKRVIYQIPLDKDTVRSRIFLFLIRRICISEYMVRLREDYISQQSWLTYMCEGCDLW